MKKFLVIAFALTLAMVAVQPAAHAAIEVEGDAYIGVYDKYLWRGFDLSGGKPVVQGGVDLTHEGFTLSYWTNVQAASDNFVEADTTDDYTGGEVTETDIILDYTFDLTDKVSVSVGNIYYILQFPGLVNTNEIYLSVALDTILEPTLTIYHDWDEAQEDGMFYTASVGHTFDVNDDLSVSLGALVSYNGESDYAIVATDPATGTTSYYSDWHNYELSIGADYAVTDQISISPSIMYSSPISEEAKWAIDSEFLAGVTATLTF